MLPKTLKRSGIGLLNNLERRRLVEACSHQTGKITNISCFTESGVVVSLVRISGTDVLPRHVKFDLRRIRSSLVD